MGCDSATLRFPTEGDCGREIPRVGVKGDAGVDVFGNRLVDERVALRSSGLVSVICLEGVIGFALLSERDCCEEAAAPMVEFMDLVMAIDCKCGI